MRQFLRRFTPALAIVGSNIACCSQAAFGQDIADRAAPAPADAANSISASRLFSCTFWASWAPPRILMSASAERGMVVAEVSPFLS